jgi:chromosome segregation ATPase
LNKIILIQEQTIVAKDIEIRASKKSQNMIDAAYEAYRKYAKETKIELAEVQVCVNDYREKYNKVVVRLTNLHTKHDEQTSELNQAQLDNEEVSEANISVREELEALELEHEEIKQQVKQKEELDGYDEEKEDKPN